MQRCASWIGLSATSGIGTSMWWRARSRLRRLRSPVIIQCSFQGSSRVPIFSQSDRHRSVSRRYDGDVLERQPPSTELSIGHPLGSTRRRTSQCFAGSAFVQGAEPCEVRGARRGSRAGHDLGAPSGHHMLIEHGKIPCGRVPRFTTTDRPSIRCFGPRPWSTEGALPASRLRACSTTEPPVSRPSRTAETSRCAGPRRCPGDQHAP